MKEWEILTFTRRNQVYWILSEDGGSVRHQHKGFINGRHVVSGRTKHDVCHRLLMWAA